MFHGMDPPTAVHALQGLYGAVAVDMQVPVRYSDRGTSCKHLCQGWRVHACNISRLDSSFIHKFGLPMDLESSFTVID